MIRRVAALALMLALVGPAQDAGAASAWASEPTYSGQTTAKLRFGATNTLFGWTMLWREPARAHRSGEPLLPSIGRGAWYAAGQTLGGLFHLATFPFNLFDIPLPNGGQQAPPWE